MLIEIDRAACPSQLAHGWACGLYWRAIRATELRQGVNTQIRVYIQVLVPDSRFDLRLRPLGVVGGLPARYHTATATGLSLCRVTTTYGGLPAEYRTQWFETYYGTQYVHNDTGRVIEGAVRHGWHPHKRNGHDVFTPPQSFMKYMRLAAQHICEHVVKVRLLPVFASPAPEHAHNPSAT